MTSLADELMPAKIRERVIDVVAALSRSNPSALTADTHLEGELGIDMIALESITLKLAEVFGLSDFPLGSARTVGELCDLVAKPALCEGKAVGRNAVEVEMVEVVIATIMRHTHYPREQLDLDAALEQDLGIDSLVLECVLSDIARSLNVSGDLPRTGTTTVRDLIAQVQALVSASRRQVAPTNVPLQTESDQPSSEDAATPLGVAAVCDQRSMKDFVEEHGSDLFAKVHSFAEHRRSREQDHLYWYGMPLQTPCRNRVVIRDELAGGPREFLMFASNNYLGLADHPSVLDAICDASRTYGATNTGCRLIGGTNVLHKELERRIAAFKQREACIVFPGGYSANIGTISALCGNRDTVVVDRFNHMSIVDGVKLAGAQRRIYQHNDMCDLRRVLQRTASNGGGKLIAVDGVFSMHGDVCDLPEIVRLAREYDARVLVDDAHATGVLGARGCGTTEHFDLKGEVDLELGTMSKALAGMGGFVVGDTDVVEYLRYYANSYVFAATIPAPVAAGIIAAIDVIESEPDRIDRLWQNIRHMQSALRDVGFDLENADSAIIPIVLRDERITMEMGRAVRARGLFCQTVVFPGVGIGDARLRISVTSEHTQADLAEAIEIFVDAAQEVGVPGIDGVR